MHFCRDQCGRRLREWRGVSPLLFEWKTLELKGGFYGQSLARDFQMRAKEVIENVKLYNPAEIILMPLYPQYSAATSVLQLKNGMMFVKKIIIKLKLV